MGFHADGKIRKDENESSELELSSESFLVQDDCPMAVVAEELSKRLPMSTCGRLPFQTRRATKAQKSSAKMDST